MWWLLQMLRDILSRLVSQQLQYIILNHTSQTHIVVLSV